MKSRQGAERGATQSEANTSPSLRPGVKVVDVNDVVEALTQLRDSLDRCMEVINDRVVSVPSKARHEDGFETLWHEASDVVPLEE